MLKPKALTQPQLSAKQASVWCGGLSLLNKEGVLLAYSGFGGERAACVTAAIASSLWATYERHGLESLHDDKLGRVFVQCQTGSLAVMRVANLLLCMCAKEDTPPGIVKAKLETVAQYLEEPLSQVSTS